MHSLHVTFARNILLTVVGLLLSSGCVIKRDKYDLPALNLPAQFPKAESSAGATNVFTSTPNHSTALSLELNAKLTEWWRLLGSSELNSLMDRALANNPDLRISTLRIAQSKARFSQAGADKLPTLSIPAASSATYPENGVGRGNANGNNNTLTMHQLSLKGAWRPDIWGEKSALYDSAELQLLRATYQRDDMQRNVVANLVTAYIEYLSLNDRLRIAQDSEKSLSEMLVSVDWRLKIGDATITDMEQQKAAVYAVKATIPVLEQQRETVLNRLSALVGSPPVEMKLSNSGLSSVKFPRVLPDMPSALLLRRPDIKAAEFRLLSADADIDVARARILPPIDLSTQVGYGSMHLSRLFMPQSLLWDGIASLSASVFDGGRRKQDVEFARAVHEELLETYIRVIHDAVREVDDSLTGLSHTAKRLEAQEQSVDSSLRAWNYSQEAFMAGAIDYLIILDTQRTYQRNSDELYNVRMDRYRSLINLFSALGGGIANNDAATSADGEMQTLKLNSEVGTESSQKVEQPEVNQDVAKKPGSIDWTGRLLKNKETHWLVELSGVYDGGAVLPAWRDLSRRFPRETENYYLFPQRQGKIMARDKERASWYRLFVGSFPYKRFARDYCAKLSEGQLRCTVVSSESIAENGEFIPPATLAEQERLDKIKPEEDLQLAEKQETERIALAKAEQERLDKIKPEEERQLAEKHEIERVALAKAEQERLDKIKLEEEQQLTEKQEMERVALAKAEQERLDKIKLEEEQQLTEKQEMERVALAKTEQERLDKIKLEEEQQLTEKQEMERVALAKTEQERLDKIKLEEEQQLAEKQETERIALAKVEQERLDKIKLEEEQQLAEKQEMERVALAKTEQERLDKIKLEEEQQLAEKQEKERIALAKAEQERLDNIKLEEEQQLAEKQEMERVALAEAEQERLDNIKLEEEQQLAEKQEMERVALAKAEQERLDKIKLEEERQLAERQEMERVATAKAQQVSSAILDEVPVKTITPHPLESGEKKLGPLETAQDAVEVQEPFWLVEMSDVYYGDNIAAAWRSLIAQFPALMKERIILPRRVAHINDAGEEGDFEYKFFIAKFLEKQSAENFCTILSAGLQSCSVVSSQSIANTEGVLSPPTADN